MINKFDLTKFKSILVYSLNYIGDTLFTSAIYRKIKKVNNNIELIVIAGDKGSYNLLKTNPYIDRIIVVSGNFINKLKTLKKEIEKKPEISVILEENFESAFLMFMLRIKYRIGIPSQLRSILLTHKTKNNYIHSVDKYLSNLEYFYNIEKGNFLDFFIDNNKIEFEKFEKINENKINIGIVPSTTNLEKKYSDKNIQTLIKNLIDKGYYINIIGGDDAYATSFMLLNNFHKNIVSFVGLTKNLSELGYLLSKMNIVIGPDTGPLHIANALNKPNIFLFGSSSYKRTGPYNKEKNISFFPPENSSNNINDIIPEDIINGVEILLNKFQCKNS